LLFFFFQAEDGIRDRTVTGVQTCALPILPPRAGGPGNPPRRRRAGGHGLHHLRAPGVSGGRLTCPRTTPANCRRATAAHSGGPRSEERRVGKECRARWSGDDGKKKKKREK